MSAAEHRAGAQGSPAPDVEGNSALPFRYAFRHEVPEEFVQLPEPSESDGWREALEQLMPGSTDEQQDAAGDGLRDQLPHLHKRENVVLTAMCVGTEDVDGEERLSMGLLAVTVRPSQHGPAQRTVIAEGIYRATEERLYADEDPDDLQDLDFALGKGKQGRQDMLLAAKLPCGPGVMSTSLRTLRLPEYEPGFPMPPLSMATLQLIAPAPQDYCVYATISTPSVFLLDSYSARLARIARTITFDEPADAE